MAQGKLIRIPVARNHAYKPAGLKSYVYLLNKYRINPTQAGPYHRHSLSHNLMAKLADGTSGAVTANDQQHDSFYTCPVQIGTPAQTLNLDFDSGSSDLWVKSNELSRSTIRHEHSAGVAIFNATQSTTYKKLHGSTWQISYGDGSNASGDVGTDFVRIGNITIRDQAIESATKMSSAFTTESSSGLLGLAWGSLNTVKPTPVKTPVENMIAQQDIPKNMELFTVCLGSDQTQGTSEDNESFYTFGSIDQDLVQRSGQQISYTPVDNSQGFWMYDSSSMTINGQQVQTLSNKAILDTGTTLALVADEILEQIYAQVPGARYDSSQQGWLLPTADVNSRPDVTFAIGHTQFTIAKEYLAFSKVNNDMSYGAIQSRGNLDFDIMGDVMLKNIYAVFDVGNVQIGCVQRPSPA